MADKRQNSLEPIDPLEIAIHKLYLAWVVKGPHPAYHEMAKRELKKDWPTLAVAVMEVVEAVEAQGLLAKHTADAINDSMDVGSAIRLEK